MDVCRCAIFDDLDLNLSKLKRCMDILIPNLKISNSYSIVPYSDLNKAKAEIVADPNLYSLFLVDILVKDPIDGREDDDGISVIRALRAIPELNHLVIVAVSQGGYTSSLAKEWGADAFIPKQKYETSKSTEAADILLPIIRGAIHDRRVKNLPTSGLLQYNHANLALTAIVENIGEKCLTALTLQLLDLEDPVPIRVFHVTAGLSGAEVLFAECGTSQLLLKVSRDLGALVRELEAGTNENVSWCVMGRFKSQGPTR